MGPLGCQARLSSQVGEPHTLQAACLSACLMSWPLLPSMAPVPLCVFLITAPSRESLPVQVLEGNKAGKLPEHYIT